MNNNFVLIVLLLLIGNVVESQGRKQLWRSGDVMELRVNRFTSTETQMSHKYYSLPMCTPDTVIDKVENIGEILGGDRIQNSRYQIRALENQKSNVLCAIHYTKQEIQKFQESIEQGYRVHWVLDNLPSATPRLYANSPNTQMIIYEEGMNLGENYFYDENGKNYILNNHNDIKIRYHEEEDDMISIIGFEVGSQSRQYREDQIFNRNATLDQKYNYLALKSDSSDILPVMWTYSVTWERTEVDWSERWDSFLLNVDPQIHWFSVINSLVMLVLLGGGFLVAIRRMLHNDEGLKMEEIETRGKWKLIKNDVFRAPKNPMAFSVLIGAGAQLFMTISSILVLGCLNVFFPTNRGGLITSGILLYVIMGFFGGYHSTTNYKLFRGTQFRKNAILTAFLFTGIVFFIFMTINHVLLSHKAVAAPFNTVVILLFLWVVISAPLSFFGSYYAYKRQTPGFPIEPSQIPREIPKHPWYTCKLLNIISAGIVPTGVVFIELFFILMAVFSHRYYQYYGMLFITFILLIIACSLSSVLMCHSQIQRENYNWWWIPVRVAGSSTMWMFSYTIFYEQTKMLLMFPASQFIYYAFVIVLSMCYFLVTSVMGYAACLCFMKKVYGTLIDGEKLERILVTSNEIPPKVEEIPMLTFPVGYDGVMMYAENTYGNAELLNLLGQYNATMIQQEQK